MGGTGLLTGLRAAGSSRRSSFTGGRSFASLPSGARATRGRLLVQYNELGGIQDDEVPGGSGNPDYTEALEVIEDEMGDYIHDNTDDEITHHKFLNAYLVSKGADPQISMRFALSWVALRPESPNKSETADEPDPADGGYQLVDALSRRQA